MPFVARDGGGAIIAYYARPQSGMSLEKIAADHPDVVAFLNPPPPTNDELIDMAGPILVAFLKAYAQREGVTLRQIRDAIIAEL